MDLEIYKQKLEDAYDYLLEQLDENPLDLDAIVYFNSQCKEINLEYIEQFIKIRPEVSDD